MAEINRRLNIVDEVTSADGVTIYVHSTPVRREIWEQHYLLMTKTIARIYEENLPPTMGARVALRLMRTMAQSMGDAVLDQLESLLLPEIWRLTTVLVPDKENGGWQQLPFEKATKDKLIDDDDEDVIRNHLAFFTAASWVHTRTELREMIYPMMRAALGAQIVSLTSMEFLSSLPTATPTANSGVMATQSSIPS
jgi:hypothetical protein